MTNEEKARQIADEIDYLNGRGWYDHTEIVGLSNDSALKMAKWKDEQVREYIDLLIKKATLVGSPALESLFHKMKHDLKLIKEDE